MTKRLHFVLLFSLISLGSVPVFGASQGSVTGIVRDTTGIPQMGAIVELLRPDLSVIATVYTDSKGRFTIPSVLPGHYSVKAMGASFLPSLRENVRVRAITVVNLTLNTLYDVMQWLPAEPRSANARSDDWAWTLRSAANRPLLRWLEDGPLVVVSDGNGTAQRLKARIVATGQDGTFGESGERFSAMVEATPESSRELLARVDFDPSTDAGIESMLGFRQDMGFAGSVQSVAAVAVHPEIEGTAVAGAAQPEGLDEAGTRTSETIDLGDEFEAEIGSGQVLARFAQDSPKTVLAALPYASLSWRDGNSYIRYSMTTLTRGPIDTEDSEARSWLPRVSSRDGRLVFEHGLHQEVGWERRTDDSGVSVVIFADQMDSPVVEAMGKFTASDSAIDSALFDRASGLLRVAGPDFSSTGMMAAIDHALPGGNHIRLSYANGNALTMPGLPASAPRPVSLSQVLSQAHPRHSQMYALALSGTVDGTRTRWRASYRWQPDDTVTFVAPFAANAAEPYLNLHICQPIHVRRDGQGGFEALIDVRNLLAQGYRPYLLNDGSILVFAQDQRALRAGLEFTF